MASYDLLDQRQEDELHKSRLLNVEERPFKRITKRLLTPGSLVSTPSKLPTPPPETPDDATSVEAERQKDLDARRQFREDVLLDFAAFDSSIARIQFLRNSNAAERERYKADKEHILQTAQAVRDNTVQLRGQLDEAKKTLEQRKKFDELAEKITNNVLLRPRKDQEVNLRKLEEECRELERESRAYGETWKERREQFGRIVEEGMQLRRLIRDEKEEVERREGMEEEDGEVGEGGSRGGQTPKRASRGGTPRLDRGGSPGPERGLKPRPAQAGSLSSRAGNRVDSRTTSPIALERRALGEGSQMEDSGARSDVAADTPMAEAPTPMGDAPTPIAATPVAETPVAEVSTPVGEAPTPRVTVDEPSEEGAIEEGEADDKMDTT